MKKNSKTVKNYIKPLESIKYSLYQFVPQSIIIIIFCLFVLGVFIFIFYSLFSSLNIGLDKCIGIVTDFISFPINILSSKINSEIVKSYNFKEIPFPEVNETLQSIIAIKEKQVSNNLNWFQILLLIINLSVFCFFGVLFVFYHKVSSWKIFQWFLNKINHMEDVHNLLKEVELELHKITNTRRDIENDLMMDSEKLCEEHELRPNERQELEVENKEYEPSDSLNKAESITKSYKIYKKKFGLNQEEFNKLVIKNISNAEDIVMQLPRIYINSIDPIKLMSAQNYKTLTNLKLITTIKCISYLRSVYWNVYTTRIEYLRIWLGQHSVEGYANEEWQANVMNLITKNTTIYDNLDLKLENLHKQVTNVYQNFNKRLDIRGLDNNFKDTNIDLTRSALNIIHIEGVENAYSLASQEYKDLCEKLQNEWDGLNLNNEALVTDYNNYLDKYSSDLKELRIEKDENYWESSGLTNTNIIQAESLESEKIEMTEEYDEDRRQNINSKLNKLSGKASYYEEIHMEETGGL